MSGLFSLGSRAMSASQAALQVTGHNIANANTAGYTRQEISLAAVPGQFTGAGFFGKGVEVTGVQRAYDGYIVREQQRSASQAAMDEARLQQLEKLDGVFALGEQGLGQAATAFFNAFVDVASHPQDLSARQVVLSTAEDFAARARSAAEALDQIQSGLSHDLGSMIQLANQTIEAIARINGMIQAAQGSGQQPNDLLDQRDSLVSELSALIPVSTLQTELGGMNVMLPGGQALVLGTTVRRLELQVDPADARLRQVALQGLSAPLAPAQMTGGALGGLLAFQAQDLPAARAQLDSFVTAVAEAVNRQQALGQWVDAGGTVQAGTAMFDASAGARGLQRLIGDPLGVAAASPVTAAAAGANTGTGVIGGLRVRDWDGLSQPAVDIEFTAATAGAPATGYRWRSDGGAWTDVAGLPTPLTLDFPVGGTPDDAPLGWSLSLSGTPRAGDVFTIGPPGGSPAAVAESLRRQNGNALAMVALRDASFVGGRTISDAYAGAVADIGLRVTGGRTLAELSTAAAEQAQAVRDARSGVNLDEEAARLIQHQQAYQASAKVLQVAQSLFDTLLQAAG